MDAFNREWDRTDWSDKEAAAVAAASYEATMMQMVGVPARTAEDALAALDWLIKYEAALDHLDPEWRESFLSCRVAGSLVDAIRTYLQGRVA
jgi:hypothetical protein